MTTKLLRLGVSVVILLCVSFAADQKAAPHSVTLKWQNPPAVRGVSIVGYNIYRSNTSGKGFVKIASRVAGPPYEDHQVVSGHTYFYVVTAVDQAGRESKVSDEVKAKIP
ncbi:MAG: fibronectin type III domain-containing protein [Terriglobales bacterium]